MKRSFKMLLPLLLGAGALCSCATTEKIPEVNILPNDSGIEVGEFVPHEPHTLIGNFPPSKETPDVPSGVSAQLTRVQRLRNKEPRYFTPASGTLQIVSIERPQDYSVDIQKFVERWRHIMASDDPAGEGTRNLLYQEQLSEVPNINCGRSFHGKLRHRKFPWGEAMMFFTTYVQGPTSSPINNDMLVLVVQGLTTDGRYAVNGRFEIHHADLPDTIYAEIPPGKVKFSLGDDEDLKLAESWLTEQADDSFTPSLGDYEKLLNALVIDGNPCERRLQNGPLLQCLPTPNGR